MKIATRSTKTLLLPVLVAVGALLLTVATIAVIGRQRHSADEIRMAQIRLRTLEARVNAVGAKEWQLIAEQRFSLTIAGELEEALDQAAALAVELSTLFPKLAPVEVPFSEYRRAVDAEVELMRAGDFEAARKVDEQAVDPGFARLTDAIRRAIAALGQKAGDDGQRTDIYSALVLGAAALVGTLLFGGLHQAHSHIKELKETEQMLRQSEQRYRDLFEESRELIFAVDLDGHTEAVNDIETPKAT